MMSKMSREKGASAEREVFGIIRDITNIKVKRNLDQYQESDSDAHIHGFCIEIKRQEKLKLRPWWNQVCESAESCNEIPVLIYRQNRQPWRVILPWFSTSYMALTHSSNVPQWVGDYEYTQTILLDPVFTMMLAEAEAIMQMEEERGGIIQTTH